MTTKVPLLSLVGHTPVTVRQHEGAPEFTFTGIIHAPPFVMCEEEGGSYTFSDDELVEVLPAKQTPHTRGPWAARPTGMICTGDNGNVRFIAEVCTHHGDAEDQANANLIASAPALLALVERVAELTDGNIGPVRADARALVAQLSGNAPACVSTASEHRA